MNGWLNASLKSTKTRDELSTMCNLKLCQDACQRLMLHPYITATRTCMCLVEVSKSLLMKVLLLPVSDNFIHKP